MRRSLFVLLCSTAPLAAQAPARAPKYPEPPAAAMAVIRESDLKRDLYTLAGLPMRGREAGTVDEMRASMWIADQLRAIGVKPAGENGTYFQWWMMHRTRVSTAASSATVGGRTLALWTDVVPTGNNAGDAVGTTVFAGDGSDSTIDVRGKIAVVTMAPPAQAVRPEGTNSFEYRYATAAITATTARLRARNPAGIIIIADSIAEIAFEGVAAIRSRGTYDVDGVPRNAPTAAGAAGRGGAAGGGRGGAGGAAPGVVLLAHRSALASLRENGQPAELHVRIERFDTPSVNIVGVVAGTDAKLKDEYVLYSSHQDHDGVRFTIAGDSTWSGADDNGSVSVALLASARAFVKAPGKRSVLFVYHGAEERGLLGSRYHAAHPVVPIDRIVAVLNGDMIGRNNPDSASLLGIQPPHLSSSELVAMALAANDRTGKFKLDSLWDRPTHPEGWYFRSDHVPYARLNVPSIEYSTNLHPDYHTPRDKPERIDYAKLTRMTQWMYVTGWYVANVPKRPALEPGFKLER
jgi:hypothetical protein